MPYIITTGPGGRFGYPADRPHPGDELATQHAVATLDEARDFIATGIDPNDSDSRDHYADVRALDENGGTIGPLPDGTVIEVKRVGWFDLADLTDVPKAPRSTNAGDIVMRPAPHVTDAQILDAFNEGN